MITVNKNDMLSIDQDFIDHSTMDILFFFFILYLMFLFDNPQNKQMDSSNFFHVEVEMQHDKQMEKILLYFLLE